MLGEVAAFAAELDDRHLVLVLAGGAVLFLDLPLDRQAVTVPAGHVVGVLAQHLLGPVDDVFQDLVERVADMQVAVRIGRTVMQDELLAALGILAQQAIEIHGLPALQKLRLALRQAGLHGKLGFWQKQRRLVVGSHDTQPLSENFRTGKRTVSRPLDQDRADNSRGL